MGSTQRHPHWSIGAGWWSWCEVYGRWVSTSAKERLNLTRSSPRSAIPPISSARVNRWYATATGENGENGGISRYCLPRPGIEPGLEVPETSVMSFSLPGRRQNQESIARGECGQVRVMRESYAALPSLRRCSR